MKQKLKNVDPLKELLKKHGTLVPSEGFSLRLKNAVITSYKFGYSKQYRKQERFGKWIIGVLVVCSLLVLIELKPSALILEMVFPIFSLAIGVAVLIVIFKKLSQNLFRH